MKTVRSVKVTPSWQERDNCRLHNSQAEVIADEIIDRILTRIGEVLNEDSKGDHEDV